jgi:hypothetical protein
MRELEGLVGSVLTAVLLAAVARRVPVFLAVGGALLAFVPGTPSFTVPPELALALFVAPILLDARVRVATRSSCQELNAAGERALHAGLASFERDQSSAAKAVRQE